MLLARRGHRDYTRQTNLYAIEEGRGGVPSVSELDHRDEPTADRIVLILNSFFRSL